MSSFTHRASRKSSDFYHNIVMSFCHERVDQNHHKAENLIITSLAPRIQSKLLKHSDLQNSFCLGYCLNHLGSDK